MLQKETQCIKSWLLKTFEQDEDFQLFSLLKYIFFSIYYCPSEATEDTCMFPGRQIKYNLPWSSNSKSVHPPALNASCVLLEHQWMFEPFLIVVFESINCPQCEKMDLKSYSHCWKGFKYAKLLENCRIYRTWRICLKNSAQFNCSEQTRDSWTTITKQKNSRGSSR